MRRKLVLLAFLPLLLVATLASTQTNPRCKGNVACPPDYNACSNWSNYYACGDVFCRPDPSNPGTYVLYQMLERYRVCFNAAGQSCTAYQNWPASLGEVCPPPA